MVREQCATESLCFLRMEELKCQKRFSRNTTGLTNQYVSKHPYNAVSLLMKGNNETFEACIILSACENEKLQNERENGKKIYLQVSANSQQRLMYLNNAFGCDYDERGHPPTFILTFKQFCAQNQ